MKALRAATLPAVVLLAACTFEEPLQKSAPEDYVPEGKVRIQLFTDAGQYVKPATRALADEDTIGGDDTWVLVFTGGDASAVFSEAVQATTTNGTTVAMLSSSEDESIIVVLANAPVTFFNGTADVAFNAENVAAALATKTLAQAETLFCSPRMTTAANFDGITYFAGNTIPMSGAIKVNDIGTDTAIGTAEDEMQLARIVAKATVVSADDDLTLLRVGAVNAPRNGSFYRSGTTFKGNTGNTSHYIASTANTGLDAMAEAVDNSTAASPVYLYEAASDLGAALLVKAEYDGTTYFYKLAFKTSDATLLDVTRNTNYTFTINKAVPGYLNLADAIAMPASNLDYTITVTDLSSHDMVSNGQYYLGVSNSELIVYNAQVTQSGLIAVTVSTDAYAAQGLSAAGNSITATTGITITSPSPAQINLAAAQGSVGTTDITVTLNYSFTTGTITLKLGNLTKTITVTRKAPLSFTGEPTLLGNDFVAGEVVSQGVGNWLSLSADGVNDETVITRRTAGELYAMFPTNIVTSGGANKTGAEFFLARSNDGKGRVKVLASQTYKTETIAHSTRTYVGAFWRATQTGERLIRIPYASGNQGAWTATVIKGADWIILDTQDSDDGNIGWKTGADESLVGDMNDPTNDALYQVSGSTTSVGGTQGTTSDSYIYFRIGLKSAHTPTHNAPARYGLVLLTYNNGNKVQRIWIRQGEDADYLLRNGVAADAYDGSSLRTLSVPYSVYNLTAAEFLDPITDENIEVTAKGGKFVAYPSQAGAFWQYATPGIYAFSPVNPSSSGDAPMGFTMTRDDGYWGNSSSVDSSKKTGEIYETCPPGYRRPTDGSKTNTNRVEVTNVNANNSEMAQSLLLNPTSGQTAITGTNLNGIWGYYADGFFDRRKIGKQEAFSNAQDNAAVDMDKSTVAYRGILCYNSASAASIFFPAPGDRSVNGCLSYTGNFGRYWSSSSSTNMNGWYLYFENGKAYRGTYQRYGCISIRCVKGE